MVVGRTRRKREESKAREALIPQVKKNSAVSRNCFGVLSVHGGERRDGCRKMMSLQCQQDTEMDMPIAML